MINLEFTCVLKSKTVAYGAKTKECGFPVISMTKTDATNFLTYKTTSTEEKVRW